MRDLSRGLWKVFSREFPVVFPKVFPGFYTSSCLSRGLSGGLSWGLSRSLSMNLSRSLSKVLSRGLSWDIYLMHHWWFPLQCTVSQGVKRRGVHSCFGRAELYIQTKENKSAISLVFPVSSAEHSLLRWRWFLAGKMKCVRPLKNFPCPCSFCLLPDKNHCKTAETKNGYVQHCLK